MVTRYHILTGEYPPDRGGVSDYTFAVSQGLADRGVDVQVYAPSSRTGQSLDEDETPPSNNMAARPMVHRLTGWYDRRTLRSLEHLLDSIPHHVSQRVLLVQYTPHAFGSKSMNVGFARWLARRAQRNQDRLWVMFHEFAYPFVRRPIRHNLLAIVNRWMASIMLKHADRAYASTEAWIPFIKTYSRADLPLRVLPIPSNIPTALDPALPQPPHASVDSRCIGHFSGFGSLITCRLMPILKSLLDLDPSLCIRLIGQGQHLADSLVAYHADWRKRIVVTGSLPAQSIAKEIVQCDAMLQVYGDGINTRRTSAMAALINGVPVITNRGHNTEPLWDSSNVALAVDDDAEQSARRIMHLLRNHSALSEIGRGGFKLYKKRFALEHTLQALYNDLH